MADIAALTHATGSFLKSDGANWVLGTATADSHARLTDEKASGTNGGTFTAGAWQTRDINTETDPDAIVTISANQFTLGAGTYHIAASAGAAAVNAHQMRIYNITDSTVDLLGMSAFIGSLVNGTTYSHCDGDITIVGTKTFELQHRCNTTNANGFGVAATLGNNEVYSQILITKRN